jgi:hypothetical protein
VLLRTIPAVTTSLLLILIVACASDIVTPNGRVTAVNGLSTRSVTASRRFPNSLKYRDAGAKPGTGRAGSAAIEVRALLGRDGNVLLEVTTGSLEAGTSSGILAKTQVKLGENATRNYNGLTNGGYWSTTYPGFPHNTDIQVQANVRGVDPRRTDVVSASTSVQRRPDLNVSIQLPSQTHVNVPLSIVAVVSEINGDVGARADCALSVDRNVVSTTPGIWVDAASTVSCAFSHAFSSAGSHTVSVQATSVNPGDWNTANNAASGNIDVVPAGRSIAMGTLGVVRLEVLEQHHQTATPPYPSDYTSEYYQNYSSVSLGATDPGIHFPGAPQRFEVTLRSDGTPIHSRTLATLASTAHFEDGSTTYDCWGLTDDAAGEWIGVCTIQSPDYAESTFNYAKMAGVATYWYVDRGCNAPGPEFCYEYTYNSTMNWADGIPFAVGSVVELSVDWVDADGASHRVVESVQMEDHSAESWINDHVTGCEFDPRYPTRQVCWDDRYTGTFFLGHKSWGLTVP